MRSSLLCAVFFAATASAQPAVTGAISPALSPRNASYTIDARLDAATRTITGSEIIIWRNITKRTVTDLQFHLYWNAWRNSRTTFMRERALGRESQTRPVDDWSRIDVTSLP